MESYFSGGNPCQDALTAFDSVANEAVRWQRELYREQENCKLLEQSIKEIDAKFLAVNNGIASMGSARAAALKKEKTLDTSIDSVTKSKQLVDELNSDLRRQLQHAKAKTVLDKQTYDSTVNKYEIMWETYKSVYLQFPLAAERHALTNKNKRDEIAIAQCHQDVLDMKEKIATMKKIKAMQVQIEVSNMARLYVERERRNANLATLQRSAQAAKEKIAQLRREKQELFNQAMTVPKPVAAAVEPVKPLQPLVAAPLASLKLPKFASPPRKVRCFEDIRLAADEIYSRLPQRLFASDNHLLPQRYVAGKDKGADATPQQRYTLARNTDGGAPSAVVQRSTVAKDKETRTPTRLTQRCATAKDQELAAPSAAQSVAQLGTSQSSHAQMSTKSLSAPNVPISQESNGSSQPLRDVNALSSTISCAGIPESCSVSSTTQATQVVGSNDHTMPSQPAVMEQSPNVHGAVLTPQSNVPLQRHAPAHHALASSEISNNCDMLLDKERAVQQSTEEIFPQQSQEQEMDMSQTASQTSLPLSQAMAEVSMQNSQEKRLSPVEGSGESPKKLKWGNAVGGGTPKSGRRNVFKPLRSIMRSEINRSPNQGSCSDSVTVESHSIHVQRAGKDSQVSDELQDLHIEEGTALKLTDRPGTALHNASEKWESQETASQKIIAQRLLVSDMSPRISVQPPVGDSSVTEENELAFNLSQEASDSLLSRSQEQPYFDEKAHRAFLRKLKESPERVYEPRHSTRSRASAPSAKDPDQGTANVFHSQYFLRTNNSRSTEVVNSTAADLAASNKVAADKATTAKAVADKAKYKKAEHEKATAEKAAVEKAAYEKATSEKAAIEKAAYEKATAEKAAVEKAAYEKATADKAAVEKAAYEKAAAKKDAAENAAKAAYEKAVDHAARDDVVDNDAGTDRDGAESHENSLWISPSASTDIMDMSYGQFSAGINAQQGFNDGSVIMDLGDDATLNESYEFRSPVVSPVRMQTGNPFAAPTAAADGQSDFNFSFGQGAPSSSDQAAAGQPGQTADGTGKRSEAFNFNFSNKNSTTPSMFKLF